MVLFTNCRSSKKVSKAFQGISVLELAIGMMLIGVIGVAVSNLVKVGVETQMSERVSQNLQIIGNNIVDDLRHDIRLAEDVSILSGGSRLRVTLNGQNVVYGLSGNLFTRTVPGQTAKTYNNPDTYGNRIVVTCTNPQNGQQACFSVPTDHSGNSMLNSQNAPKQIRVDYLAVQENAGQSLSIIDQQFGTANFTLKDFAFDVYSATEFQ